MWLEREGERGNVKRCHTWGSNRHGYHKVTLTQERFPQPPLPLPHSKCKMVDPCTWQDLFILHFNVREVILTTPPCLKCQMVPVSTSTPPSHWWSYQFFFLTDHPPPVPHHASIGSSLYIIEEYILFYIFQFILEEYLCNFEWLKPALKDFSKMAKDHPNIHKN